MSDIGAKIRDLLNNIAKQQNYTDYELKVTPTSSGGASFTTFLYTATITGANRDDLNLFVKFAAMGEKIREDITVNIYQVEQFAYTELRIAYKELEERHKVPDANRFYFSEYFGANMTPLEEILVLENLAAKGFTNHDRFKPIDWEYASTAVTELAKFHALSMGYQRDYPNQFQNFSDTYAADWINEQSVKTIWKPTFETSINVVRDENKAKVKKFFDNIGLEEFKNLYKPSRCKVLAHNDFRTSNLMHRRKDNGTLEVVVLDLQTVQVSCPVLDLLYIIFTGTDKAFRDEHYQRLLNHYFTELIGSMKRLHLDPGIYTREDFDYELKEKLPFGLVVAAFTLLIVTADTEDTPQLDKEMDLNNYAMTKTGPLFPYRLNGIVDDYVRWGVLSG